MKSPEIDQKVFVDEKTLIEDSYRLAVKIYESGFRPDFLVGIWRGGSTVAIYVQECLQYLGVKTDHIAIRTSYRGLNHYLQSVDQPQAIRAHGLQYLFDHLNHENRLLLVDDVFSTGHNIDAVLNRLQAKAKRNMPHDVRVASVYYKPGHRRVAREPDYCVHAQDAWFVLPYELNGLTPEEIRQHKPWVLPMLEKAGLAV